MEFTPHAKRAFHLQSYGPAPSIDGVELVELKRFADDGGTLTELARLSDGRTAAVAGFTLRQINYSELAAGAIKAFHLHTRQTDVWYVPPGDRLLVVLVDVRQGPKTEGVRVRLGLCHGASRRLRIPPGAAHAWVHPAEATGRDVDFPHLHSSAEPATSDAA